MAAAITPELLLDQHFSDLDEYSRQIGWDIEMRQLDAGMPHARVILLGTSKCMVLCGEFNRAYHQAGHLPADYRKHFGELPFETLRHAK